MSLEWLDFHPLAINIALSLPGIVILVLLAALSIVLFVRSFSTLRQAFSSRLALHIAVIVLVPICALALILHLPSSYAEPIRTMPAALLGLVPITAAALFLDTAPAMLV